MEQKQKRVFEGLWDCDKCGHIGNKGAVRECPNCGAPRNDNTIFYMAGHRPKPVEPEKAKTIDRRPDWVCKFCSSLNPASITECKSCGAPRNADNLDYFQNREKQDGKPVKKVIPVSEVGKPDMSDQKPGTTEEIHHEEEEIKPEVKMPKEEIKEEAIVEEKSSNSDLTSTHETEFHTDFVPDSTIYRSESETSRMEKIFNSVKNFGSNAIEAVVDFFRDYGFIVLIVGIVILLGIAIFKPKIEATTIDNLSWNRSIKIERYQTVNENDWTLPQGARLIDSKVEYHRTDHVFDGYETKTRTVSKREIVRYEEKVVGYKDLGNGYFEEITENEPIYETKYYEEEYKVPVYVDVPVYDTKYYYEIDKWLYDRTLSEGAYDKNPYWPDTSNLSDTERTAGSSETYTITFKTSDGDTEHVNLDYAKWSEYKVGDEIIIKRYFFGLITKVQY